MTNITAAENARLSYASFVLDELEVLYVETPKAACSSFKHVIASLANTDYTRFDTTEMAAKSLAMAVHDRKMTDIPSLTNLTPEKFESVLVDNNYLRFCVIRNPFARLASAWSDRLLCHSISPLAPAVNQLGFPQYRPDLHYLRDLFSEFVGYLYANEAPGFSNHHWRSMEELLLPDLIHYNLEIRSEALGKGLARLVAHIEERGRAWPGLGRFNENPIRLGLELYTPTTRKRVAEMYALDFTRYDYPTHFESRNEPSCRLLDVDTVRGIQERNQRIFNLSLRLREII